MTELANRSLDRGITLMEVLSRLGEATLADLARESGLPKSTIRRLLGTLIDRRIVRRSLADGRYRINIALGTGIEVPEPLGAGPLVDVAMPVLSDLTRAVSWPSDLHIIDGTAMRIIDSTRPLSPFHLYRGVINRAINIFGSATGQACLAGMADQRIMELMERERGNPRFGFERFSLSERGLMDEINRTRERGYGLRLRQYRGETVFDDGLAALAVPVHRLGVVIGAISLLFPRRAERPEVMARRYLDDIRAAAVRISNDMDIHCPDLPQTPSRRRVAE